MSHSSPPVHFDAAAILDLDPLHPQAFILEAQSSCVQLELEPFRDLIILDCDQQEQPNVPPFNFVLDRLKEDRPVALAGQPSMVEIPGAQLCRILRDFTVAVRRFQTPGPSTLGIVIPSTSTDFQRRWLLHCAFEAGWKRVQLCNRTECFGRPFVKSEADGTWVVLATSYGPSELSVIRFEAGTLTPIRHFRWDDVSCAQLDRHLIQLLLEGVSEISGANPDYNRFGADDWDWLRQRANLAGQKLNLFDQVDVELPGELSGHSSVTVPLQRAAWLAAVTRQSNQIAVLMRKAIDTVDLKGDIRGCIVSGDLVRQSRFLQELRVSLAEFCIVVAPNDTAIRGACDLMQAGNELQSPDSDFAPALISPPARTFVKLVDPPQWVPTATDQELAKRLVTENTKETAGQVPNESPAVIEQRKADRRKRAAKHSIKLARRLLDEQDLKSLEQAVQLSHQANENSKDEQTFRDVIEIHLKAAASRPPRIETFDDDAKWLLCAFGHDPTDAMQLNVVDAISHRYLTHVEQLTECRTVAAAAEAFRTLEELLARVPCEQADEWLEQLKSDNPESVVCKRSG